MPIYRSLKFAEVFTRWPDPAAKPANRPEWLALSHVFGAAAPSMPSKFR
jgi:hypothetical protein